MIDRRQLMKIACSLTAGLFITPAAAKAARILLVHGRAQHGRDPAVLKSEWVAALSKGAGARGKVLDAVDVAFPFYGDTLDKFASQYEIPLTVDIQTRGSKVDAEFLAFQADVAEAVRQRAGITDAQVDAEYGTNPRERGAQNWEWVQAILAAIDKHGGGMSRTTLETFMRDVYLYTNRAGVRDEIDRIVAGHLTEAPTIVIGHSLGSVVTYHVLRTDRRRLQIPLYVTLGSPLGIRSIRDQLRPLRFPAPAVEAWYNAFDSRDVVALYPLDSDNFPVKPSIENNGTVKNHTDNRHGIAGYLDDANVARRIVDALAV